MNEEWLTTDEAAQISGLSSSHIRYLLRNGKVQGKKLGRDWLTTRSFIQEYLASNPKPGPKPRKPSENS